MTSEPIIQTESPMAPASDKASTVAAPGLRERAARTQKQQQRFAIALLAVLIVGGLGVYVPQKRAITAMRAELAQTEQELTNNAGRAAILPQLMTAVTAMRRQVDQYKPLRGRSDIERAMHEISSINTSTQLANYKYDMDVEKPRTMCREQPLKITFQADFVDAMSFIQKLEAMDRLTRLRELAIDKKDGTKNGNVTVTMSLSLFFDPNAQETK